MAQSGCFFAVVGPSGAGKDTLIDAARAALAGDPAFVFVRRVITRPAEAGGEVHEPATPEDFEARERSGGFALTWRAHGLAYGIPIEVDAELSAGRHVIANLSRTVIPELRARYTHRRILCVEAPRNVLAQRLAARGRESREDIERRLAQATEHPVEGPDVTVILNDGALEAATLALLRALAP